MATDSEDPEERIRELERGPAGETPAAPPTAYPGAPFGMGGTPPFGMGGTPPFGMGGTPRFGMGGTPRWQNIRPWRGFWIVFTFLVVMLPLAAVLIALYLHFPHSGLNPFGSTTVPRGGVLTVGGSNDSKTVACNDGDLNLGGDNMTFTVTGHCRRLMVAGDANHVTVDSADTINAYGDDNTTIYHSGSPIINKTGTNTVSQG
jgi:hypothetical protein